MGHLFRLLWAVFVTFIEDFSRYGHIELICEMSESLDDFMIFKTNAELHKRKKIKTVNSDRHGEYYRRSDETSRNPGPFARYLQECGIDSKYTMLETPQLNEIAERRNRTFLDMV